MTKVIIWDKSGQPLEHYFTWPVACSLGDLLFCHSFLIVSKTPMPLLGQDSLSQLNSSPRKAAISAAPLQEQIDSTMWTEEMSEG
jgi:hypothetical protein